MVDHGRDRMGVGGFSSDSEITTKTDRRDIAEILLKVALSTIKPTNQINSTVIHA